MRAHHGGDFSFVDTPDPLPVTSHYFTSNNQTYRAASETTVPYLGQDRAPLDEMQVSSSIL